MIPGQTIRNTSYATVFSVIREIEIWRAAVLMLSRHAGDAEANSFRRAVELAAEGDHVGRRSGVGSRSPLSSKRKLGRQSGGPQNPFLETGDAGTG
jgi:hypothetical protein